MSDNFLDFLVAETYKLQEQGEHKLNSFETLVKDYGLYYIRGEFVPNLSVFRFATPIGNLDAPITWKVFDFENKNTEFILLDNQNDPQKLYSVLKEAIKQEAEKLYLTQSDGFFYLVFIKKTELTLIEYLKNKDKFQLKVA
jgi:hypothetical protein